MNTMIKRIMTLVASIALSSLFAVQVSAAEVSVPITFESAKTASVASAYGLDSGVDGTNTALYGGNSIGAVFSISTECAADINTVKISSNYTATHDNDGGAQDVRIFFGDLSTLTMWGSVVSNNNDTSANFPLIGAIFSDAGGSASATGIISGTWTSSGATSSLDIALWVSAPNIAAGSTMSAEKPVVIIDYKPGSYCGEVQNPINPQGPSQAAVHCPAPGDINRLLTPDGDCDGDGMTNQQEGYDPDQDGNPITGTLPIDINKNGIPDYLEKPDGFAHNQSSQRLANTGSNRARLIELSGATLLAALLIMTTRQTMGFFRK